VKNEIVLERIVSPIFSENCYVAAHVGRTDCLVFDPGSDFDSVIALVERHGWTPAAILNTHGHADHIAGNAALKERWPDLPLLIGEKDASKLSDADENLSSLLGLGFTSPPADRLVKHGDLLDLAGFELQVRETPGHSIGHVVFVWKGTEKTIVFGGDVLFEGSIGRTDFPDGDFEQLAQSIREQLYTLPADTIVLPGHGPPTTIGAEIETNPFVPGEAG
jgi:hydroxyacylglutathione hydrolase